jgi:DNA-binding MarR family transcriptional regulator
MPTVTELELAAQLRVVVTRLARRLRQLDVAADGITMSMVSALYVLEQQGPMPLGDLAVAEKVQPPTMTRLVARLEELGLVARGTRPGDRRVVMIALTDEGRRLVGESRERRTEALAELLRGLGPQERSALAAAVPVLDRLSGPR